MSDPVRLLSSARDGVARALLESAVAPDPTDAQCDELFRALARRLPEAVVAGAAGATAGGVLAKAATSKAVGLGLLVKGAVAVGVVASLVGVGTAAWRAGHEAPPHAVVPPASPVQPRSVNLPTPIAPAPPVADDPTPSPSPSPSEPVVVQRQPVLRASAARRPPTPTTPKEDPPSEVESPLHAESASLLRARQMLRSGECSAALTQLNDAATRFPHGALSQEREVLSIEALACSGRATAASLRATTFLRDYPTSPHASAARRFAR
jgi:hypothetical protein